MSGRCTLRPQLHHHTHGPGRDRAGGRGDPRATCSLRVQMPAQWEPGPPCPQTPEGHVPCRPGSPESYSPTHTLLTLSPTPRWHAPWRPGTYGDPSPRSTPQGPELVWDRADLCPLRSRPPLHSWQGPTRGPMGQVFTRHGGGAEGEVPRGSEWGPGRGPRRPPPKTGAQARATGGRQSPHHRGRIQFSSPCRFLGGPGMFSRTSWASWDLPRTTPLSFTAVCILRTFDWFLRGRRSL